jgi:uncharacterized membrane-anchored protein YhcB (DUF1043 family)
MELATWVWILLALVLGAIFGSISWRLKKRTRAHMDLLDEMRAKEAREASGYHDDYHTTENVMERAVIAEDIPIDAIEN